MELALNSFWFVLALCGFALWLARIQRRRSPAPRALRPFWMLVAMACALTVLFPVISLTDDLHEQEAVAEDSSARLATKRSATTGASVRSHKLSSPPALKPHLSVSPVVHALFDRVPPEEVLFPRPTFLRSLGSRAPPALFA